MMIFECQWMKKIWNRIGTVLEFDSFLKVIFFWNVVEKFLLLEMEMDQDGPLK